MTVVPQLLPEHRLTGKDGISLRGVAGWFEVWHILGNPARGECEVKGWTQIQIGGRGEREISFRDVSF